MTTTEDSTRERAESALADAMVASHAETPQGVASDGLDDLASGGFSVVETWELEELRAKAGGQVPPREELEWLAADAISGCSRYGSPRDFARAVLERLELEGLRVVPAAVEVEADPVRSLGRLGELAAIRAILGELQVELESATEKFGPFASAHEGFAIIREEVDELWDEIKADKLEGARGRMRREALQVAAMGARFLLDVPAEEQA